MRFICVSFRESCLCSPARKISSSINFRSTGLSNAPGNQIARICNFRATGTYDKGTSEHIMSEVETKEVKESKRPVLLQDSVEPKDSKAKDEPKGFWRRTWESWRSVVIVVAALMVVRSVVADWNDVPTGSMKPTIMEGDRIFV